VLVRFRSEALRRKINNINNLHHRLDSRFSGQFSQRVENTRKRSPPGVRFVGIFVGIGEANGHGEFRYSERKN
jgi:hypothetical protein